MPKWFVVVVIVIVGLGLVAGGAAFAAYRATGQTSSIRPWNGEWSMGMNRRGEGLQGPMFGARGFQGMGGSMHEQMLAAWADALDLSVEDLTARLEAGETLAEVADRQGLSLDELATVQKEVMESALQKAVGDGVLTQEQADWMLDQAGTGLRFGAGPMMLWGRGPRMHSWGAPGPWGDPGEAPVP